MSERAIVFSAALAWNGAHRCLMAHRWQPAVLPSPERGGGDAGPASG